MVTLSLVLGGTAIAATATHGDKKADTKLVRKLAPSLSVKHAKTANSATTATSATHATSSDSATHATSADSATNATHATSADSATNATHATGADSATTATTAGNANALGGSPASAFVKKSDVLTRHWSCAGTAWENTDSTESYSLADSEKFATGGSAIFRCSVDIPDGAVVTEVDFSVVDNDATNDADCELWSTAMASGVGDETFMAGASTSGTPGNTQIGTTDITSATVDNAENAYFVQCFIDGTDASLGLYGANITYTVSAANAAPRSASPSGKTNRSSSTRR
jgi:hypothetical protein